VTVARVHILKIAAFTALPLVLVTSARADSVSYRTESFTGEFLCTGTASGFPVATITQPGYCADNNPSTITASSVGWVASAFDNGGGDDSGSISAITGVFDPAAVILGGIGSGFFKVEYTDSLKITAFGGYYGEEVSISAGDLSLDEPCTVSNNLCAPRKQTQYGAHGFLLHSAASSSTIYVC